MTMIKIFALSGSLRRESYNTALINAVSKLSPSDIEVTLFDEMALLPLFNPDRENESIISVKKLKAGIKEANGILISSPEYAHGVSGVLKNALDWLVSGDEFPYKPVVLVNTSPRATHAQLALREIISTMSGNIIECASLSVPLLGTDLDVNGIIDDEFLSQHIIQKIQLFRDKIIECE